MQDNKLDMSFKAVEVTVHVLAFGQCYIKAGRARGCRGRCAETLNHSIVQCQFRFAAARLSHLNSKASAKLHCTKTNNVGRVSTSKRVELAEEVRFSIARPCCNLHSA